jgi:hypothetical protein
VHPDKVQPVGVKLSADGKYGFVAWARPTMWR